ncbi:hypothetical protein, partial [Pseudomonas sp. HMSC75E02]|uniref:hypothetical protein n=1 Tax=Pseudomonas sp. HMSC75E02 TaxID=1608908 RepID=UPI001C43798F
PSYEEHLGAVGKTVAPTTVPYVFAVEYGISYGRERHASQQTGAAQRLIPGPREEYRASRHNLAGPARDFARRARE